MASEKREQGTPLRDRIYREFYRFSFFRAVGLLESFAPEKTPLGQGLSPTGEAVRFSVKPGFIFPPSDISSLNPPEMESPVQMEVTFMGLVGPSGVLPDWYNELVAERMQQKDFTLSSFLDMFNHHLISLFYLAWKKYRFDAAFAPGDNSRFSRHLMCLIGLGTEGLAGGIGLPWDPLIFYGGLLSRQVPSAAAIESAVGYCSGVRAEVYQFVDRVISLDPGDYTQIGIVNAEMGVNAICGSETWENQTKFRVCLGPMSYQRFVRFLPSGDLLQPIFSLLRYMSGIEFDFEVRLILRREEVPPCRLGGPETQASPHLGWSTWVKTTGESLPEDPFITFRESDVAASFAAREMVA